MVAAAAAATTADMPIGDAIGECVMALCRVRMRLMQLTIDGTPRYGRDSTACDAACSIVDEASAQIDLLVLHVRRLCTNVAELCDSVIIDNVAVNGGVRLMTMIAPLSVPALSSNSSDGVGTVAVGADFNETIAGIFDRTNMLLDSARSVNDEILAILRKAFDLKSLPEQCRIGDST